MIIVLFIYSIYHTLHLFEINTQLEYSLYLIISIIFLSGVLAYYIKLPRTRFSEDIFIYVFFIIMKLGCNDTIPNLLDLEKGY